MKNVKTAALLIEQGFGARLLLQSKLLDELIKRSISPIILTSGPNTINKYLTDKGYADIPVHPLETKLYELKKSQIISRILQFTRFLAQKSQTTLDHLKIEKENALLSKNTNTKIFLYIVRTVVRIAKFHHKIMFAIIRLENKLTLTHGNSIFFDRYKPDILITTSIGTFDNDAYVMREAKSRGLKILTYVLSWDNTSSKGFGTNLSDHIIVWSPQMLQDLMTLHYIPQDKISIGGVPHFDAYSKIHTELWDKDRLYSKLNIKPNKKIILFGSKSPNNFSSNLYIARLLCELFNNDSDLQDYLIICRLHPIYFRFNRTSDGKHFGEDWNELQEEYGPDTIMIDYPEITDSDLNYFMSDNEILKLGSLLKHSKLCVNMFSTLNLEASIFDVPAINVCFEDPDLKKVNAKIARYDIRIDERQTHNQRVINSGATKVVYSAPEFIHSIKQELQSPEAKKTARSRLVASECHTNIGTSSQCAADLIQFLAINI